MPQHPRLSLPLVLIPIDATLVRHGRTDQARQLRKAVAKIIEG